MASVSKRCQAILFFILSSALRAEVTENHLDEMVFIPGELISIPCEVDIRVDYLHFTWTKDDKTVSVDQKMSVESRTGSLIINSPTRADQGRYRCFANNSFGISMSGELKLLHAFHLNFKRSGSSEIYIPEVGSAFIISCQPPSSHPPSRVYWALESDRLPEEFVDGERIDTDFQGNLYLSNVELRDGKRLKYFCMSHNQLLGSHNADDGRYLSPLPRSYVPLKAPTLMWSSPVNDTAIVGSKKTLKCIFGGMPTPVVTWSDASKQLAHVVISRGNEFSIPHVDSSDEGTYECRAQNRAGQASMFINLRVEMKPTWSSLGKPPSFIEIDVDSNITINCDVTALPLPTFQWFVNGTPLRQGGSTRIKVEEGGLTIHQAMLRDTATFQCLASNEHGSILTNVVFLVKESQPYFEAYPQDQKALLGFNVTFKCRVRGAPKPEISWFKGIIKSKITSDFRYVLHPTGSLQILVFSLFHY